MHQLLRRYIGWHHHTLLLLLLLRRRRHGRGRCVLHLLLQELLHGRLLPSELSGIVGIHELIAATAELAVLLLLLRESDHAR